MRNKIIAGLTGIILAGNLYAERELSITPSVPLKKDYSHSIDYRIIRPRTLHRLVSVQDRTIETSVVKITPYGGSQKQRQNTMNAHGFYLTGMRELTLKHYDTARIAFLKSLDLNPNYEASIYGLNQMWEKMECGTSILDK